ncbi:CPBP family intramembrane glutamic endopeptidase [Dyella japonica]|uniref:Membrane protease YdiL (CAAX protease family) n=1 Tax=Dyella japonica TaxID=231455 RepID=A0ABV2JV85_9GAMM
MPAAQIAFTTPASATPWQRWVVLSPVGRIVFFVALYLVLLKMASVVIGASGALDAGTSLLTRALAYAAIRLIPSILAYTVLVKAVERRSMDELDPRDIPRLGTIGLVGGALLMSIVVLVLWLGGIYHVSGTDAAVNWLPAVLTTGLAAAIDEEICTRGVIFRITEEGLGTWSALVISAVLFGAAHIFNPGASMWSSLAIAIEAGVLLALLYHVTRSLWPCIGLHAAWNVMQGTVFGIPVSGTEAHGWLVSSRTGPDWLSGGVFGAEASVVALIVCSACSALLLIVAIRRGTIVPPAWRRAAIHTA